MSESVVVLSMQFVTEIHMDYTHLFISENSILSHKKLKILKDF